VFHEGRGARKKEPLGGRIIVSGERIVTGGELFVKGERLPGEKLLLEKGRRLAMGEVCEEISRESILAVDRLGLPFGLFALGIGACIEEKRRVPGASRSRLIYRHVPRKLE
jgi:hypothetical protein